MLRLGAGQVKIVSADFKVNALSTTKSDPIETTFFFFFPQPRNSDTDQH